MGSEVKVIITGSREIEVVNNNGLKCTISKLLSRK
jgi:hypothetical protein